MKRIALIIMIVAAFAVPVAAQAQSNGYGDVAGATQGTVSGPGEGAASTSAPAGSVATVGAEEGGILPFTGTQLALVFGAAVLLLGTGVLLRRARAE